MKDLAEQAVTHARDLLLAERLGDIRVDACFHYGAVDISPRYLVVWVLLAGAADSDLPEWYTPEDTSPRIRLEPELVSWLAHLRQIVRSEFAAASWPDADNVDVLFDSEHRVRTHGGWEYFK